MRLITAAAVLCGLLLPSSILCADATEQTTHSAPVSLPRDFKPPQVFKNTNLLRNINLEKGYARETINVVVENVDKEPQSEYYLRIPTRVSSHVGGLEVRNKKAPEQGRLDVEATELDPTRDAQYFIVHLPKPLAPSDQITLGISYSLLNSLSPLPAAIKQTEKQYLTYAFSAYASSAYTTVSQKTKLKLPTANVPDYTTTSGIKSGSESDPDRKGSAYTYGPYETAKLAPGTEYPVSVRYEYNKPVITAHLLERDIEVSQWGGNIATEERYWMRNNGSQLENQFSRLDWTLQQYQNAGSSAVKELKYPLKPGSVDPYFIDDIGNVSTSHYRPGKAPTREGLLELRPRYPIFGGWNYSFKVGWNSDLSLFLRRVATAASDSYILKVPFLEGPKMAEGVQYEKVVVRVVLPEGAKNVRYEILDRPTGSGLPSPRQIHAHITSHKTFMDTLGRTALTLTVENLTDEARDAQLMVTYDYTFWDGMRKPVTIVAGVLAVFVTAWVVGNIDVSIKKR